jgi:hypothetical protein
MWNAGQSVHYIVLEKEVLPGMCQTLKKWVKHTKFFGAARTDSEWQHEHTQQLREATNLLCL